MKPGRLVGAIVSIAFVCAAMAAGIVKNRPPRVVILFTGEQQGYLVPCGCTKGMLGGIDRRATAIRKVIDEGDPVLILDNGGLMEGVSEQARTKRTVLLDAMETMGYRAVGVGKADIDAGYDSLIFELEEREIALLCANVTYLDGSSVFEAGRIFKFGSRRIGVTAALDPELIEKTHPARDELKFIDPAKALKPVLRDWKTKTDIRVLLYHGPHKKAIELVREFGEINLVISGYDNDLMVKEVARINGTPIAITGLKAKYLGRVDIPGEKATIGRVREIELSKELELAKDMLELLGEYRRVIGMQWDVLVTDRKKPLIAGQAYVPSMHCGRCHKAAWEKLKTVRHGRAMESLVKDESDRDPECVVCHVVGMEYKSGYISPKRTPGHGFVGCDSCHGPGAEHMRNPIKANAPIANAEESCLPCHNLEHSPNFDYEVYRVKTVHPTPDAERKELREE